MLQKVEGEDGRRREVDIERRGGRINEGGGANAVDGAQNEREEEMAELLPCCRLVSGSGDSFLDGKNGLTEEDEEERSRRLADGALGESEGDVKTL